MVNERESFAGNPFDHLQFQYPFRRYQTLALNVFDEIRLKQNKFHIIAPPGSGKTILGVEIIRRIGKPALIFSPTTTIQEQWKEKFSMFVDASNTALIGGIVSSEAKETRLVNTLTYQVLGTQTENKTFLKEMAEKVWVEDLLANSNLNEEEAKGRIAVLESNNPESFAKEISKYQLKAKRELLENPDFNVRDLLHSNAKRLIDTFVKNGTGVVILDECHHLLDYWAVIIRELVRSLKNPFLVGLTATPPLSATERELENYLFLIGDIDFEVPTPAVVKEGNLAPYQDLVRFVCPTEREMNFLKNQKEIFLSLIRSVSENQSFRAYFFNKIIGRQGKNDTKVSWEEFLNKNLELAIAGVKYLISVGIDIPDDVDVLPEMRGALELDDWLILLEDYCLNYLKLSRNPSELRMLKETKAALKTLGIVMTDVGFRQYISPTERILSLSDSKNIAATEILREEYENMGERLRATVITDFEKSSALALKSLAGILDPEAGGAVRALRHLVKDEKVEKLDPVLLTGKTILIDSDFADTFVREGQRWLNGRNLEAVLKVKPTDDGKICEIVGEGKDWEPKNYVAFTTSIFESGLTKCIIGTRGLLGEGWDSLSLNTLIDLTSAGTFTMVNQIRGRSLRLDPKDNHKVANNWDVVCVAYGISRGMNDFERLLRKHSHFYGLTKKGSIVKGVGHVDEKLTDPSFMTGLEGLVVEFQKTQLEHVNRNSFKRARERQRAYEKWEVGKPYSNFVIDATKIDRRDMKFKTAYTFKNSLKKILYLFVANFILNLFVLLSFMRAVSLEVLLIMLAAASLIAALLSARYIYIYFKKAFIELPIDSYLMDFSRAILQTLKNAGFVSKQLSFDNIRVTLLEDGYSYCVNLDYTQEEEVRLFSECFREIMSPITDQRYLVNRNEASLDSNFFSPLWYTIRQLTRILRRQDEFYHPVPKIFSQNKELAMLFSQSWAKYVGGGRLVYTRSEEGRKVLLKNRISHRLKIGLTRIEEWK